MSETAKQVIAGFLSRTFNMPGREAEAAVLLRLLDEAGFVLVRRDTERDVEMLSRLWQRSLDAARGRF